MVLELHGHPDQTPDVVLVLHDEYPLGSPARRQLQGLLLAVDAVKVAHHALHLQRRLERETVALERAGVGIFCRVPGLGAQDACG